MCSACLTNFTKKTFIIFRRVTLFFISLSLLSGFRFVACISIYFLSLSLLCFHSHSSSFFPSFSFLFFLRQFYSFSRFFHSKKKTFSCFLSIHFHILVLLSFCLAFEFLIFLALFRLVYCAPRYENCTFISER